MSKFLAVIRFIVVSALFIGTVARAEHSSLFGTMAAISSIGIINGRDAKPHEYPGAAKFFKFTLKDGKVEVADQCSTVVVSGCVIGAAHCFKERLAQEFIRFPNGDVFNIRHDTLRKLTDKGVGEKKATGVDIAVVKLDKKPKQSYTREILATSQLPEWKEAKVKNQEEYERVKGKGIPGTLVAYGPTFSTERETTRILALPKAEQTAAFEKLQERRWKEYQEVKKQVGEFEVLGPASVVAYSELLERLEQVIKLLGSQEQTETVKAQLKEMKAQEKELREYKAYVAYGTPSAVAIGDSGGPVFAKDENGVERLVGIAEGGDELTYSAFSPIFENKAWLDKQLDELGCKDEEPAAPPKSFDEMGR